MTVYEQLVTKVDNIDTTRFVLKTKYDTEKSDLEKKINDTEKKIPDTNNSVKKTDYNFKIAEIENKILDVSGLVNKTYHDAKILDIESKYTTTSDYNKFTKDIIGNSIKSKNLVTKTDCDTKLQGISKQSTSNKFKHLLVESKLKKLQRFDSSNFRDKDSLEENYLVFKST